MDSNIVDLPPEDTPTPQASAPSSNIIDLPPEDTPSNNDQFTQYIPDDLKSIAGDPWSPDWMKAVAKQESNFDPTATSPTGAQGLFQFTQATAKDFNLSNRKDGQASYRAAHTYLTKLLDKYNGNRDLALAAYNWGPKNVDASLASGKSPDQVIATARKETRDYVPAINKIHDALVGSNQSQIIDLPDPDKGTVNLPPEDPLTPGSFGGNDVGIDIPNSITGANNIAGGAVELYKSIPGMVAKAAGEAVPNLMNVVGAVMPGQNNLKMSQTQIQERAGQLGDKVQTAFESVLPDSLKGWLATNDGAKAVDDFFNGVVNKGIEQGSDATGAYLGKKFGLDPKETSASLQNAATILFGGMALKGGVEAGKGVADWIGKPAEKVQGFRSTSSPGGGGGGGGTTSEDILNSVRKDAAARAAKQAEATPTSPESTETPTEPSTASKEPSEPLWADEPETQPKQGALDIPQQGALDFQGLSDEGPKPPEGPQTYNEQLQAAIEGRQPFNPDQGLLFGGEQSPFDFTGKDISSEDSSIFSSTTAKAVKAAQEDMAWGAHDEAQKAEFQSQTGADHSPLSSKDDVIQPAQGSRTMVKIVLPAKMRGSTDMFNDLADVALKGMDVLKASLRRLSFGPFSVGDTVRLVDGRIGRITDPPTDKGVFGVRVDGGEQVQVPVSGIHYKYQYSGDIDNPIGYKKPVYIPGKQGGAINLGAFWKSAAKQTVDDAPPNKEGYRLDPNEAIQRLYTLFNRSDDVDEFKRNLQAELRNNLAFDPDHLKNAQGFWDEFSDPNFEPPKSPHSQIPEASRRLSVDTRPLPQAVKEDGWNSFTDRDDIAPGKHDVMAAHSLVSSQWTKKASRVLNNLYGQLTDINASAKAMKDALRDGKKAFMALPRQSRIAVQKAMVRFDHGDLHDQLAKQAVEQGRYWPTHEELTDLAGLSEEEAHAYEQMAAGYDHGYQVGKIDQPKLFGYMPHTWEGVFRAKIFSDGKLVGMKGFATRRGAEDFLRNLTSGPDDELALAGSIEDPRNPSLMSNSEALLNDIRNWQGEKGLSLTNRTILQKRIMASMQAYITENMDRDGVHGFLGEGGPLPEDTVAQKIVNRWANNKQMNLYDKYVDDVTRSYKNYHIVRVAQDFYRLFPHTNAYPNMIQAATDMFSKATGFAAKESTILDKNIQRVILHMGFNPGLWMKSINALNSIVRELKTTSLNVAFAGKHLFFPVYGLSDLIAEHSRLSSLGQPTGDVLGAAAGLKAAFNTFEGSFADPVDEAAYRWFQKTNSSDNIYSNSAVQNTAATINHGLLNFIISRGRAGVFMANFKYFKSIMPFESAKRAAETATKRVMQSFDPIDKPSLYNEGSVGRSLRPFTQIWFHQLTRAAEALAAVKNNKGAFNKMAPITSLLATQLLVGGASGLIGAEAYDALRSVLNYAFDTDLPSAREWFGQHVGDWARLGLVSKMTGIDMSGTFSFPSFSEAARAGAGIDWAENFGEMLIRLGARAATGEGDVAKIYRASKNALPSIAGPLMEYKLSQEQGTTNQWLDNKLEPVIQKKPGEDALHLITSGIPYRKAYAMEMRNELMDENKRDSNMAEKASTIFMQHIRGLNTGRDDPATIARKALEAGRGVNPDLFFKNIVQKSLEAKQPWIVNYVVNTLRSSNQLQLARRVQNLSTEFGSVGNALNQ